MATVGYIITAKHGPLTQCKGQRGFYRLLYAGHSKPSCTLFGSRDEAKSAILADREYQRHFGIQPWDDGELRIIRVQRP
jgi:hypothetical protein